MSLHQDPFEIRSEFEHSTARMADAIASLRSANLEMVEVISALREKNDNQRIQLEERGEIIFNQEREVELLAKQAVETKELLAAMQHKLLSLTEDNLKTSKALTESVTARLSEEHKHLAYVERMADQVEAYQKSLDKISSYRKTVLQLTNENVELHLQLCAKWIWKKPHSIAKKIQEKLSRRSRGEHDSIHPHNLLSSS